MPNDTRAGATAIILCGGRSTRMGRDKASLSFGRETMLARIERIVGGVTDRVIVVGRRDQDASTVHDAIEDQGPLAGIAAGLAASDTDLNVVVACDMPLIKPALLEMLIESIGSHEACVGLVDARLRPFPGIYRSTLRETTASLLAGGERRATRLLEVANTKIVSESRIAAADPGLESYVGCNTVEELRSALGRSRTAGEL